jgi:predicted DNA-binding transcriptional regulator AlpA
MSTIDASPPTDHLISLSDVASRCSVSHGTVDRWRREGLPVHRLGPKMIRVSVADLEAWLASRRDSSTGPVTL